VDQIVRTAGDAGAEVALGISPVALDENVHPASDESLGVGLGKTGRFSLQAVEPRLLRSPGYVVGKLRGVGARAWTIGEKMDAAYADPAANLDRSVELFLGFPGESDDHVGGEAGVRDALGDPLAGLQELTGVVSPPHRAEDRIVPGLKGQMKVRAQAPWLGRHEIDEAVVDLVHLDRREADSPDGEPKKLFEEIGDHRSPLEVLPIRAEVNAGEHELLVAGLEEPARLVDNFRHGAASRSTADLGDDAEAAGEIATVLDLEEGASVTFEPRDPQVEDVAIPAPKGALLLDEAAVFEKFREPVLIPMAHDPGDSRESEKRCAIGIGGATGDGEAGVGIPSAQATDETFGLLVGGFGDGAGVDDVEVRAMVGRSLLVPAAPELLSEGLTLVLIDLASEGDKRERRHGSRILTFGRIGFQGIVHRKGPACPPSSILVAFRSMARVLCAMSGGIDSSVAAWLLREQGHEVTGVFLRNGVEHPPGGRAGKQGCCSVEDTWDARRVADSLGIPFYVLNFESDFRRIVDYFVAEYDRGATPNPCVLCNRDLKFGRLFDYADAIGAEFVATGHYARVEEGPRLLRGIDAGKDQSYFLFPLRRGQLARVRFPVGGMEKAAVRETARRAGLRVAEKPESMEICFVPDNDYRRLIRERIPERVREGAFVTTRGEVVGRHGGHQLFTVGQRKGLGVALGRPMYVVAIDAEKNAVVVGEQRDLERSELTAREVNWIDANPQPGEELEATVQIRYRHPGAAGRLEVLEGGRVQATFSAPQRAVTPGQAAVFYRGDSVLGGGWIE